MLLKKAFSSPISPSRGWLRDTQTGSLAERFATAARNPIVRKNVAVLMTGKLLGLAIIAYFISWMLPTKAFAAVTAQAVDPVNAINTVWTLVAAFLVFCMQVGFVMLEAGFARSRESVNILVEGIADTCICGLTFWAWGFAFMFMDGTPFIGTRGFFLQGLPETYGATGVPLLAFWLFQFTFADTCSTITSGAMVGRTGFVGDLLYSVGVTGFIYPILGHWAWGPDGWLATMGAPFRDFAGSTVVHTIGGVISLIGAIVLGPRIGRRFKRDGGGPWPAHDIIIGACGGLILWFGWYGFNPGSTLSAMDIQGIGRVSFNTTLAAVSAGMAALLIGYARSKIWDLGLTVNGFLGGLVAITAPCYWVDGFGAFVIGGVAAVVVVVVMDALEYARIDDPIGAVPVHMGCGIWGTLALGLFASGQFGVPSAAGADTTSVVTGLFYGGGVTQLVSQLIGSLSITGVTLVAAFVLMKAVNATKTLRVSAKGELMGLDIHEHGAVAYPEYAHIPSDRHPLSIPGVKVKQAAPRMQNAEVRIQNSERRVKWKE